MPEKTKTRRSYTRFWIEAAIGVVLLATAVALAWYLRSPGFEDFVRRKLVATLEDATGGRVDLPVFSLESSEA